MTCNNQIVKEYLNKYSYGCGKINLPHTPYNAAKTSTSENTSFEYGSKLILILSVLVPIILIMIQGEKPSPDPVTVQKTVMFLNVLETPKNKQLISQQIVKKTISSESRDVAEAHVSLSKPAETIKDQSQAKTVVAKKNPMENNKSQHSSNRESAMSPVKDNTLQTLDTGSLTALNRSTRKLPPKRRTETWGTNSKTHANFRPQHRLTWQRNNLTIPVKQGNKDSMDSLDALNNTPEGVQLDNDRSITVKRSIKLPTQTRKSKDKMAPINRERSSFQTQHTLTSSSGNSALSPEQNNENGITAPVTSDKVLYQPNKRTNISTNGNKSILYGIKRNDLEQIVPANAGTSSDYKSEEIVTKSFKRRESSISNEKDINISRDSITATPLKSVSGTMKGLSPELTTGTVVTPQRESKNVVDRKPTSLNREIVTVDGSQKATIHSKSLPICNNLQEEHILLKKLALLLSHAPHLQSCPSDYGNFYFQNTKRLMTLSVKLEPNSNIYKYKNKCDFLELAVASLEKRLRNVQ